MDEDIRKWVREQLAAGFTVEQLKASVGRSGWDSRIVDEVVGSAPPVAPRASVIEAQKPKKKFNWFVVMAIVLTGLFVLALFYFSNIISGLLTAPVTT